MTQEKKKKHNRDSRVLTEVREVFSQFPSRQSDSDKNWDLDRQRKDEQPGD